MAYNVPSYDTTEFSFGPCVIYMGAAGATPTTDVGGIRSGATYELTRTLVDIKQGNPATLVKTYVTEESGALTVTSLQWDFTNFARALGVTPPTTDIFDFGGAITVQEVAIKIVHEDPAGATYEFYLWKARGGERLAFNFGDDPHEFEYTFNSIIATTDWANNSLSSGNQLFRLYKVT